MKLQVGVNVLGLELPHHRHCCNVNVLISKTAICTR